MRVCGMAGVRVGAVVSWEIHIAIGRIRRSWNLALLTSRAQARPLQPWQPRKKKKHWTERNQLLRVVCVLRVLFPLSLAFAHKKGCRVGWLVKH